MPDPLIDDLLVGFTAPSHTRWRPSPTFPAPAVQVVLDGGTVIYVGRTGNLRNVSGST
ncbi:hypothetical protein ACVCAH_17775 [Micromonospora sp. LZ34]